MSTRERVLSALLEADDAVSGEWLARKLGLSRNSVWKAIGQLREEGYGIEAATNRGYRLTAGRDVISEAGIRRNLNAQVFGGSIEVHREIDSTNNRAKALAAQGAPHGTLVCAMAQTGGRGRFGRVFHSPEGSGIYISFVLRPKMPAERAVMLTSMTAVAVARAIEQLADVQVQIKGVNDLFISGKKTCGILCEAGMDFESGQLEYAVAGIGVNVGKMTFPEELADIATSVGNACGREISKNQLIARICDNMEALYDQLDDGGFMEEYRARSNVIGKRITVLRGGERFSARALDIDDQGGLVVETQDGIETVRSGEISIRLEDQP